MVLTEYGFNLSNAQKKKILKAALSGKPVSVKLNKNNLSGSDSMMVTMSQHRQLMKGKPMTLKLSKNTLMHNAKSQSGNGFFDDIANTFSKGVATVGKVVKAGADEVGQIANAGVKELEKLHNDPEFRKTVSPALRGALAAGTAALTPEIGPAAGLIGLAGNKLLTHLGYGVRRAGGKVVLTMSETQYKEMLDMLNCQMKGSGFKTPGARGGGSVMVSRRRAAGRGFVVPGASRG